MTGVSLACSLVLGASLALAQTKYTRPSPTPGRPAQKATPRPRQVQYPRPTPTPSRPVPTPVLTPTPVQFLRGDVDRNGVRDIRDIEMIGRALDQRRPVFKAGDTTLISPCWDAADADDNGRVDVDDAIRLISYLYGDKVPLPAPSTAKGVDPTSDPLPCVRYP